VLLVLEDGLAPFHWRFGFAGRLPSSGARLERERDGRDFVPTGRRESSFTCHTLQRIDLTLSLRIQPYGKEGGLLSLTLDELPRFCAQCPEPH
jgi:hypothetical protein